MQSFFKVHVPQREFRPTVATTCNISDERYMHVDNMRLVKMSHGLPLYAEYAHGCSCCTVLIVNLWTSV